MLSACLKFTELKVVFVSINNFFAFSKIEISGIEILLSFTPLLVAVLPWGTLNSPLGFFLYTPLKHE